ncbi:Uncharacterised protein [Leminorella richardii]|uniref:Uncharacterized protein n=1 Tax=Leminorella richardii TaxID=158841 RepID=A0A2X4XPM0_9GAMM|nr:Uncharacterised protein [Leminorella richardii]
MNIALPDWYDELLEFECESKGCVLNLNVVINGEERVINFYDLTRFSQDVESELNENGYFNDENAVILLKVTKNNIMGYLYSLVS